MTNITSLHWLFLENKIDEYCNPLMHKLLKSLSIEITY